MANPARKISDEGIDSLIASQAMNELFQQERQSRKDRVSIWLVSVGMVAFFLILVLFMIQIVFSRPKNTTPTESAWYCQAVPLLTVLSWDRSGSVLPSTCHTALEQVLPAGMKTWQRSLDQAIERTKWKKVGQRLWSGTSLTNELMELMVSGMISRWEKSAVIRGLGTALWQKSLVK